MKKGGKLNMARLSMAVITTLFCATLFLGCATIAPEELQEKDTIIKNLTSQIEVLKGDLSRLESENRGLLDRNSALEEQLKGLQTKETPAEKQPEDKIK